MISDKILWENVIMVVDRPLVDVIIYLASDLFKPTVARANVLS